MDFLPRQDDKEIIFINAGDLDPIKNLDEQVGEWCNRYKEVLVVLGNHDFYNQIYSNVIGKWRALELKYSNFHLLDNDTIVIDGTRYIGSTLWTDFKNRDITCMSKAEYHISDFYCIHVNDNGHTRPFRAADAADLFDKACSFLKEELSKPFGGQTVVITHFSPSMMFLNPKYAIGQTAILNPYFHASADALLDMGPDYWIFGHTHDCVNEVVGDKKTIVIANPRGYNGREETGWDPELVIVTK